MKIYRHIPSGQFAMFSFQRRGKYVFAVGCGADHKKGKFRPNHVKLLELLAVRIADLGYVRFC